MSPWSSRGWTALELAKSPKVKVIFKGCHGPTIKNLDEEIFAKEEVEQDEDERCRTRASRIIRNPQKKISHTQLLTPLSDLRRRQTPRSAGPHPLGHRLQGTFPSGRLAS